MKSIMQTEKKCAICGTTLNLHKHHVFHGKGNRTQSEKYGLTVYLCAKHHNMSAEGVHMNRQLDLALMTQGQRKFEEQVGSREEFRKIFGRSYL